MEGSIINTLPCSMRILREEALGDEVGIGIGYFASWVIEVYVE